MLGGEECRGVRVKVPRVWAAPPDANYAVNCPDRPQLVTAPQNPARVAAKESSPNTGQGYPPVGQRPPPKHPGHICVRRCPPEHLDFGGPLCGEVG